MDILTSARQRHARAARFKPKLVETGKFSPIRWRAMYSSREESAGCIWLCIWTLGQSQEREALEEVAHDYEVHWLEPNYTDDTDDTDVAEEDRG